MITTVNWDSEYVNNASSSKTYISSSQQLLSLPCSLIQLYMKWSGFHFLYLCHLLFTIFTIRVCLCLHSVVVISCFVCFFFFGFRIINWMVAVKNEEEGIFTARSFAIKVSVYCNSNSGCCCCCWEKFVHSSIVKITSNYVRLSLIFYIIFLSASKHLTPLNKNHKFVSHSTFDDAPR